jgi:hemolysin III
MFASSAAYHLVQSGPRLMRWLRTLDHSAIYLLIAGTYTPICPNFFDGFWR